MTGRQVVNVHKVCMCKTKHTNKDAAEENYRYSGEFKMVPYKKHLHLRQAFAPVSVTLLTDEAN